MWQQKLMRAAIRERVQRHFSQQYEETRARRLKEAEERWVEAQLTRGSHPHISTTPKHVALTLCLSRLSPPRRWDKAQLTRGSHHTSKYVAPDSARRT